MPLDGRKSVSANFEAGCTLGGFGAACTQCPSTDVQKHNFMLQRAQERSRDKKKSRRTKQKHEKHGAETKHNEKTKKIRTEKSHTPRIAKCHRAFVSLVPDDGLVASRRIMVKSTTVPRPRF